MKKKGFSSLIFVLLLGVFLFSCYMLYTEMTERKEAQRDFTSLAELVTEISLPTDTTGEDEVSASEEKNISRLQEMNGDCIGWLSIAETTIDYPVMYTPKDPEKYLRRDFDGKYSVAGTPFLDARCDLEKGNLIIYGHNIKGGLMFASLKEYLQEDFRKEHPVITLKTAEETLSYTVRAVKIVTPTDDWYQVLQSENGVQYLTLSTCYGAGDRERLLVIAKKERQEE